MTRVDALRAELDRLGVAAAVSTAPANQTYLAGFRALLYSRPILLVVTPEATTIIVPGLEETHARGEAKVDRVRAYYEHPLGDGPASHLDWLDEELRALPSGAAVGIESSACPEGLARHIADAGHRLVDLDPALVAMRQVKDATEIDLIADAARVTGAAVAASIAACREGITEIEVDGAGTAAMLAAVAGRERNATVDQLVMTPSGTERSELPHAFSTTRRLEAGDVLIHTRQVGLDGYRAELERTVFVGAPDGERRRAFELMRAGQAAAIGAVRAGVPCSKVDRAARDVLTAGGFGGYAIHRSGHGIGLSPHEPPYLRFDNDEPLEEGMVITIEPGIYVPGLGGFRHSDTVVVTSDGPDLLTEHPTDLGSLVAD